MADEFVFGVDDLTKKFQRLGEASKRPVRDELAAGALILQNGMRSGIQKGPKTGTVYTRGSIEHQASAPGEYPASDTGRLANSISIDVRDQGDTIAVGPGIASDVVYARRLEFGGTDSRGVTIEPRPYVRPTWRDNIKKIRQNVIAAANRAIKRAAR